MKRHLPVTFDMDRDARNHCTEKALHKHGLTGVHVLTMGESPTLVLMTAADELGFIEVMAEQGWSYEKIDSSSAANPAYWVRHPSPFAAPEELAKGRVFPPDSPAPGDVEYVQHPNGCVFRRVDCGAYSPRWRKYKDDDGEYTWSSLNSSSSDGSPMIEVFLPKRESSVSIGNLSHPVWRAVEGVVTPERLSGADQQRAVVDLIYDVVVESYIAHLKSQVLDKKEDL
jgi:hypothetical protein